MTGEDTSGQYTVTDTHVPHGGGPPVHRHDFEEMFTTGSWLVQRHQGRGVGKEMRARVLHLAFAGLGAVRIVISDFMSLDGVIQAPGGRDEDTDGGFQNGGWSMPFFDPAAMGPVLAEVMARTAALLFGRRTWQTMAAAWPGRAGDPFADRMNEMPKYVASRTLTQDDLTWSNSTLLPAPTSSLRCDSSEPRAAAISRSWAAPASHCFSSAPISSTSTA